MELRPYQARVVDFLIQRQRAFAESPAGSGKTIMAATAVARVAEAGMKVGWLANTRDQIDQGIQAIQAVEGPAGVEFDFWCVAAQPDLSRLDVLVIDECFPAGTRVSGRPIEDIREGDLVDCVLPDGTLGRRAVTRVFRSTAREIVRVTLSNAVSFRCTLFHPVFTQRGWVPAFALENSDVVFYATPHGSPTLPLVPDPRSVQLSHEEPKRHPPRERARLLQPSLQQGISSEEKFGNDVANKPKIRFGAHETAKSDASRSLPEEGDRDSSSPRTQAKSSAWQWVRADGAPEHAIFTAWRRMGDGTRNSDPASSKPHLPGLLQGGPSVPYAVCGRGSRWVEPPLPRKKATRRQEGRPPDVYGLVSVASVERVCNAESPESGSACAVFNLEVDGAHNYFAEGVLVHNCHHLPAASWHATFGTARPGCRIFGFSATPWADPVRDALLTQLFGGLENFTKVELAEVKASGHLAEGVVIFHDLDVPDMFKAEIESKAAPEIKRRCAFMRYLPPPPNAHPGWTVEGEHRRRVLWQMTQEVVQNNHARNAAAVYIARSEAAKGLSGLLLVGSIEHGRQLAEQIGPHARLVHGKSKTRKADVAAFRKGEYRVMVASSVGDEGLDVPVASFLVLMSGGRSPTKIIQRAGRVMRPYPGKTHGIVHDFLDRGAPLAYSQARARKKIYASLGYEIKNPSCGFSANDVA